MFLIFFTFFMNIFMTGGDTLLFSFFFLIVYLVCIFFVVFMLTRIVSLVCATSIFITYTTSPTALTGAIESLLSPLRKIKLPVHEFAMMMTITLRFIPVLLDETEKIINAQKARGADFYSGNILKRAKALVPILIPLIVSAFSRAEELAVAMECRCYRVGEGRTKMKRLVYAPKDFAALMITAAFIGVIIAMQQWVYLGNFL
jgi:energy-coupling factor transport system permease protein